ncbi:MAG: hypothetical protein NTV36_01925 [Candidatus Staskawiczbacteria bacterium]|nr:hypothetical protein [Candidatus Staskawiczbacteria bacterium]
MPKPGGFDFLTLAAHADLDDFHILDGRTEIMPSISIHQGYFFGTNWAR